MDERHPVGDSGGPELTTLAEQATASRAPRHPQPVLELSDAALRYGSRELWSALSMTLRDGEFVAILGANGSGKTTLLRVILGLQRLSAGAVRLLGRPPARGDSAIGYVQQQRRFDPLTPLRARDVVRQGLDGHRWGPGWRSGDARARVDAALRSVGALPYRDRPIGLLSGGEQQRVRIAQAIVADPRLLLCDEPLLSLDLSSQRAVTSLIDERRRAAGTAVLFVTHEINPVLPYVDRVLYLVGGRFRLGSVDDVLNSETLSELYGTSVEVIRAGGGIVVTGAETHPHVHPEEA